MTTPKCRWQCLCIVLLTITAAINGLELAAHGALDAGYPAYDDPHKYEVIDLAHQNNAHGNAPLRPGRTTRILTDGEVDDAFWLKHLGEDFRHAVHMQVDGSDADIKPENATLATTTQKTSTATESTNPVGKADKAQDDETNAEAGTTDKMLTDEEEKNSTAPTTSSETVEPKIVASVNATHEAQPPAQHEAATVQALPEIVEPFERTLAIDDVGLNFAKRIFSPNSFDLYNEKHNLHTKSQYNAKYAAHYNNYEYTPTHNTAYTHSKYLKPKSLTNAYAGDVGSPYAPIVINLPDNQKYIQQDAEQTPVVVRVPPIIYHGRPAYEQQQAQEHAKSTQNYYQEHDHSHAHHDYQHQPHSQAEHASNAPSLYNQNAYNPHAAYASPPSQDSNYSGDGQAAPQPDLRYMVGKSAPNFADSHLQYNPTFNDASRSSSPNNYYPE